MDANQLLQGVVRRVGGANRRTTSTRLLAYLELNREQNAKAPRDLTGEVQGEACCLCGRADGEMYSLHRRRLCVECVDEVKAIPKLSPWPGPSGKVAAAVTRKDINMGNR